MQFQPYLNFDGQCAEAMTFYQSLLGGRLEPMLRYDQMPPGSGTGCADMPAEAGKRILHTTLTLDDGSQLLASDVMPGRPFEGMKNVGIALSFPDLTRGKQVFDAFAQGGQINMPWGETFWVERFGAVVDRFGTSWLVNAGRPTMG